MGVRTRASRCPVTALLRINYITATDYESSRRSWNYAPGQRRVRLAPELSYDTPNASSGGALLYDEVYLFTGRMDRFDFKLLGRKEMFMPGNNYTMQYECNEEKMLA